MTRLSIAIDPQLAASHGPEVQWTWRTMLTGMGFAWRETAFNDPTCDIAYVTDPTVSRAKLTVRANPAAWSSSSRLRLTGVDEIDSFAVPRFGSEPAGRQVLRQNGRVIVERDLAFDVFWLATGQDEPNWPQDDHGFFDLDQAPIVTAGVLRRALASGISTSLERLLVELNCGRPEPRWPGGKKAAGCVAHDVDYPEVVRVIEPLRVLKRQGLVGVPNAWAVAVGRRHHWHFASWLDFEEKLGLNSAFYFVARRGSLLRRAFGTPDPFYDIGHPRFRALFRELVARGAEIGLQASYHACESPDRIAHEKRALEEAARVEVVGNRHHYWRLRPDDPAETLRFHELAGLAYDCSLFHDRYVGWRRGFSWPFFPYDAKMRRPIAVLQIPTAWMDAQLFTMRRHNPGNRASILNELIEHVVGHQGCLMFDVHEYVFDDALYPGWAAAYRYVLEALATRSDVWLARPVDVAWHWVSRARALADASVGLGAGAPARAAVG